MICPTCQTPNREAASFCKHCGNLLLDGCPRCGTARADQADYCDVCGLALAPRAQFAWLAVPTQAAAYAPAASPPAPASQPALPAAGAQLQRYIPETLRRKLDAIRAGGEMVGERRVVTMLFCDVKGSTAAAERLDPEDWTEIMNGAFEQMIRPIYQYEGTVARLMGDALLAFFGAPIAHEDDPRRAVLAGLAIVGAIQAYRAEVGQRWGLDFNVRVGINTGLVVVGAVGSDLRMEYSALGDAINLAARMEQTAGPGTVQIAQDTYRLVAPLFDVEALGGIEVKGKAEPVTAYRVLRPRAAPGRQRGIEGLQAQIVGREEEVAALRGVLAGLKQGVGHIVGLVGEAGQGKSRLIEEARQIFLQAGGSEGNWLVAACLSYESGQAYALLRQLVGRLAGLATDDPAGVVAEKLARLLAETEASPQERMALETLLGLEGTAGQPPLEGEGVRRELARAVEAVWRKRFAQAPAVVVCDDLHWGDAASTELLARLLPLVEELPLVMIFALRPDREAAGWRLKSGAADAYHHRYTELDVQPLTTAESDELVDRLLTVADLPEDLRARIYERTGGNPFFIEEVIRNLIEIGAVAPEDRTEGGQARRYWHAAGDLASLDIPDSLQSLLTARIDRLEEHVRRTVQLASVVGRSFYYKVLRALEAGDPAGADLDRHLQSLLRAEMIQEAARLPEVEYRFRNPLTQEIAYQTILLKRRRELHCQVAEAIEALFPDRLAEYAPRLSFHFLEAQMPERALKYLALAGDVAFRLYANAEAVQHYDQAIAIAGQLAAPAEQIETLYLRRGRALELDARFEPALESYRALEAEAQARGDRRLELAAVAAQGTLYSLPNALFDYETGAALARRGLDLAREAGDGAAEAKLQWNLLNLNRFANRAAEAEAAGQRSLALARELNLREQLAYTLNDLHYVHLNAGRTGPALEVALEARDLWRELGNRVMLADNLSSTVMLHVFGGDIDTGLADSQEALAISRSIENAWGISFSQLSIGTGLWMRGEFDRAIAALQTCIEYADRAGFSVGQSLPRAELGYVYALLGQPERGLALAESSANGLPEDNEITAYLRTFVGLIHLTTGDWARAEAAVGPAAQANPNLLMEMLAAWAHNPLMLLQGKAAEAAEAAEGFLQRMRTAGFHLFEPDALLVIGQAKLALGETEAARRALAEALAAADALGLAWYRWQILAAQAEVEAQAGLLAAAQARLGQARETLQAIAGGLRDPALRESLLARPVVRALFQAVPGAAAGAQVK